MYHSPQIIYNKSFIYPISLFFFFCLFVCLFFKFCGQGIITNHILHHPTLLPRVWLNRDRQKKYINKLVALLLRSLFPLLSPKKKKFVKLASQPACVKKSGNWTNPRHWSQLSVLRRYSAQKHSKIHTQIRNSRSVSPSKKQINICPENDALLYTLSFSSTPTPVFIQF